MTTNILCHLNDESFTTKQSDIRFMGKLRDKMIQKPWDYVSEPKFIDMVTRKGHSFYGNIFQGGDLMETGKQRECWRAQSIVAVDIDKTTTDPQYLCHFYTDLGLIPWMAYPTFSDGKDGLRSYRILWRVEVDHKPSYDQWGSVIKALSRQTDLGDKRACDSSRLWAGSLAGPCWHVPGLTWTYKELVKILGLD